MFNLKMSSVKWGLFCLGIIMLKGNVDVHCQVGAWSYEVTSLASSSQRISVIVASSVRDPNDPPIVVRPYWATQEFNGLTRGINDPQSVHAAVSKGRSSFNPLHDNIDGFPAKNSNRYRLNFDPTPKCCS